MIGMFDGAATGAQRDGDDLGSTTGLGLVRRRRRTGRVGQRRPLEVVVALLQLPARRMDDEHRRPTSDHRPAHPSGTGEIMKRRTSYECRTCGHRDVGVMPDVAYAACDHQVEAHAVPIGRWRGNVLIILEHQTPPASTLF